MNEQHEIVWHGALWRDGWVPPVPPPAPPGHTRFVWEGHYHAPLARKRVEAILARARGPLPIREIQRRTELCANTISSVLTRLVQRGQAQRVRPGVYQRCP